MTLVYCFPGQGAQHTGMGERVFKKYPHLVIQASDILGFDVESLCLSPNKQTLLNQTRYTQPALFVVNALSYIDAIEKNGKFPDIVMGHSLGELNALYAAGAFDFGMGVTVVNQRAQLMAQCQGGAMLAVLGWEKNALSQFISDKKLNVDLANINTNKQIIVSGKLSDIELAERALNTADGVMVKRLNVSGAFHSREMEGAVEQFKAFCQTFQFSHLKLPVVSNVNAAWYQDGTIANNLSLQLSHPVRWFDSIRFVHSQYPDVHFSEIGPGQVLTGINRQCLSVLEGAAHVC